jgi:NAD-dependent SIR2 family protein deacetylase
VKRAQCAKCGTDIYVPDNFDEGEDMEVCEECAEQMRAEMEADS